MKTAIITGANGFVGSAFVRELLKHDVQIWALDREGCNNNIRQSDKVTFVPFDLADIAAVKDIIPIGNYDFFFHFAWAGSAGLARTDTALQLQNAQWTVNSLRLAKELGCKRFICAGSIMEHEAMAAAYTQGNKPGLGYIYGGGKLIAHVMCKSIAAEIGIELVWAEITNAYGVGEFSPRMVNTTIRKVIAGEPPQFTAGNQNYDFVYIDDVARAFYLIGKNGKPFYEYLIGSSTARPLRDFLLEMKASIAPNLDFIFGDIPFTGINLDIGQFDCSQTERDTGFRAEVTFAEGVKRTKEWIESLSEKN
ncbi:nucleoside-diphosphate-sugar epimerase [Flexilinea flocculi]|uniref:Nucleoside-diphosphate-sugar epimerase n=1 Tax=Flexilinea flocculi TaxID=1678840 RepID=A0A0K8PBF0_9CHLR|nr:nucleoside-diphosphate-sugar epimerase [Flexilinea flocculi]